MFANAIGKFGKDLFAAASSPVRSRSEAERISQHATQPDNLGDVLLAGQRFVMMGSDLKEVLGKLPGYCQQTSSGAVIDSKRLALELKRVPSRVACCPFDQVRVGLRINGGQSHPSNVMQNAGSIGEI